LLPDPDKTGRSGQSPKHQAAGQRPKGDGRLAEQNVDSGTSRSFGGFFQEVSDFCRRNKPTEDEGISYWRQSIKDYVTGVTQGYMQTLELKGIGFSATIGTSSSNESKTHNTKKPRAEDKPSAFFDMNQRKLSLLISSAPNPRTKKSRNFDVCHAAPTATALFLSLGLSYVLCRDIPKNHVRMNIYKSDSSQNDIILIFGISKYKVNRVAADIYRHKEPEPYTEKGLRYDGEKFFSKRGTKKK
jgi:ribosomal protein L6P/L9E